jgi:hypothetical protein
MHLLYNKTSQYGAVPQKLPTQTAGSFYPISPKS